MEYTTLGNTGMEVSRICLGCWSLGLDSSTKEEWSIGIIPWSPLAQGYLARPHEELTATTRGKDVAEQHEGYQSGSGPEINARVEELADDRGVSMAQIALSWVLHQETVDAPIVGVSSIEHLEEAVEALDISLSDTDIAYLEEPYQPIAVAGHD